MSVYFSEWLLTTYGRKILSIVHERDVVLLSYKYPYSIPIAKRNRSTPILYVDVLLLKKFIQPYLLSGLLQSVESILW